jgi:hypothetical protein
MMGTFLFMLALASAPHPGGTDANGCHRDRKAGTRHCHGKKLPTFVRPSTAYAVSGTSYRNCAAARAAGATPVRRGDPGYGRHLDRDGDGIGCE